MPKNKNSQNTENTRSEGITIRLSPRIRYGLELLCRKQHRSTTSVIERVLEIVLSDSIEGLLREDKNQYGETYQTIDLQTLWSVDEIDRLLKLVEYWPTLMTHEEEVLWNLVSNGANYWVTKYEDTSKETVFWETAPPFSKLRKEQLLQDWNLLKKISGGEKSLDDLPGYERASSGTGTRKIRILPSQPTSPSPPQKEEYDAFDSSDDFPF